jgi:hypothetical protein
MASNPCNAVILMASVVHGSTELGIPTNISIEEPREDVIIRGAGKVGPSCRGEVGADLVCVVDFLVKGFIAVNAAAASLVFTGYDSLGNSVTYTMTNMKPRTQAFEMNRNSPPGTNRQRFAHQGDMDSNPLS